jgi:anti-sigma factor RsiW
MSDFEAWLGSLERQIERLPALHGELAGLKAELRRLAAYARGRADAPVPPAAPPAVEPAPASEPG